MKPLFMAILMASIFMGLSACKLLPPGHDPNGPGNSENAPGQNKECGKGPGKSGDAPGQAKKNCRN